MPENNTTNTLNQREVFLDTCIQKYYFNWSRMSENVQEILNTKEQQWVAKKTLLITTDIKYHCYSNKEKSTKTLCSVVE